MQESNSVCGYCKASQSIMLYPVSDIFGDSYSINKCKECNAYFLAPRPTKEQLSQAYDDSYYGEKEEKFDNPLIEKVLDFFRQGRAKALSKHLKTGDKVLDIGCGNGRFLKYLLKFGKFELFGTELDGNSAKRATIIPEINLKIGTLEKSDFEENYFDAVTLFHVFEHLEEPKEMLQNISRVLKPGGILVISFPNIASWQARKFKGNWLHLDPPRHLLYFAPNDFINLLKNQGYDIVSEHYRSSEQNPYGMVQSTLNNMCVKREVLFESLKGNSDYIKDYSKFQLLMQKMFFALSFPVFVIADIFMSAAKQGATVEFTFRKK